MKQTLRVYGTVYLHQEAGPWRTYPRYDSLDRAYKFYAPFPQNHKHTEMAA